MALRLAWHMAINLDRFDWRFNAASIASVYFGLVVLWPLVLLVNLKGLIDPTSQFRHGLTFPADAIELVRLWESPPPCGRVIRYRQRYGRFGETYGDFQFLSADVEESASKLLQDSPCPPDRFEGETDEDRDMRLGAPYVGEAGHDESAILKWVRGRSDNVTFVAEVPRAWKRFNSVASDLVRNGKGRIMCIKCGTEISPGDLLHEQLHSRSWSFDYLRCPQGHEVLEIQAIHFHRSKSASEG